MVEWHPTPVLLPRKSHGRRSLVGWGPWGRYESDTTERLHFHFSLSCIGEGNGNPLQCSCLGNPRDGKPGGLPSMGSHRVGQDWSTAAAAVFHCVYIPHLLYLCICWWILGLLSYLDMLLWILGCLCLFKLNDFSFYFFVYKPRSWIIESYGSSMLFFRGIPIMLSIVAVPIYIPTNNVQRFPFLHILSNICYL